MKHTLLGKLLALVGRSVAKSAMATNEVDLNVIDHILYTTPLRLMSSESDISPRQIEGIVHLFNHEPIKGIRALLSKSK